MQAILHAHAAIDPYSAVKFVSLICEIYLCDWGIESRLGIH